MGCGGSTQATPATVEEMTGHDAKETNKRRATLSQVWAMNEGVRIASLNSLSLDRVLANKEGLSSLKEFAAKEYSTENVTYWAAMQEYKLHCRSSFVKSSAQGSKLKRLGSAIIKQYLCDGAPEQLNVPSDVLQAFKQAPPDLRSSVGSDSPAQLRAADSPAKMRATDSPGKLRASESFSKSLKASDSPGKLRSSDGVYTYTDTLFDKANHAVYLNLKDTFARFRLSDLAEGLLFAEPLLALAEPAQAFQGNVKVKVKELLKEAQQLCACERISLWAVDGGQCYLVSGQREVSNAFIALPVGRGLVGHAVRQKAHLCVDDAYAHPKFSKEIDEATGFKTRSVLCVVFKDKADETCRGALQLVNKVPADGGFSEADGAALHDKFAERFISLSTEAAETLMLEKAKQDEAQAA